MSRLPPLIFAALILALWQVATRILHVPPYILPDPLRIAAAFIANAGELLRALAATLAVTAAALLVASLVGIGLALGMSASRWAKAAIEPWAIALQVTPVVAIAPLIIAWVGNPFAALVVCAAIVAFFPVFANTAAGLAATPADRLDLFRLYGAGTTITLWHLRLPYALPYILSGIRIAGGLALVGAVVAEFVAGSGGFASGLAYRILEAGYRLEISKMFAALGLLAATGIAINAALGMLARLAPG